MEIPKDVCITKNDLNIILEKAKDALDLIKKYPLSADQKTVFGVSIETLLQCTIDEFLENIVQLSTIKFNRCESLECLKFGSYSIHFVLSKIQLSIEELKLPLI